MDNLAIYNSVREVPKEALREIQAGRLKGKSDINPMWRIKTLTEQFGPCGIGWKYVVTNKWLESAPNGEIAAFVDIVLFIKFNGEWSDAIPGTGGSSFVANERNGPYVSDECFKMALTDAISVSCKALGMGADVYWSNDTTKYGNNSTGNNDDSKPKSTGKSNSKTSTATKEQINHITALAKQKGLENTDFWNYLKEMEEAKKISSQYSYNKEKRIQWTVDDIKALQADLETPF